MVSCKLRFALFFPNCYSTTTADLWTNFLCHNPLVRTHRWGTTDCLSYRNVVTTKNQYFCTKVIIGLVSRGRSKLQFSLSVICAWSVSVDSSLIDIQKKLHSSCDLITDVHIDILTEWTFELRLWGSYISNRGPEVCLSMLANWYICNVHNT